MIDQFFRLLFVACGPLLACGPTVLAQPMPGRTPSRDSVTTIGEVIRQDGRLNQLIPASARIEVIGSGFGHLEGPVWVRDSTMLLFSDSEHQTIYRWSPTKGLSKFLMETGYTGRLPYSKEPGTNGLAINEKGELLICEHGDRRIARLALSPAKNGKRTLVDNFGGKRLNSPNDVLAHPSGNVYFTDPPFGLPKRENDSTRETPFSGVYRLAPTGKLTLLTRELPWANGLALWPNRAGTTPTTLYLTDADSLNSRIMAYPMLASGQLGRGRVFFAMNKLPKQLHTDRADGLKTDRDGNVWAAGHGGVLIFSPAGQLLGRISTGETIANIAWGDDGSTLYMASGSLLCRIRTSAKGW